MKRASRIAGIAVTAALLFSNIGVGDARYLCVGSDGHVGLKTYDRSCTGCCEEGPSHPPVRTGTPSRRAAVITSASPSCGCVDIPSAVRGAGELAAPQGVAALPPLMVSAAKVEAPGLRLPQPFSGIAANQSTSCVGAAVLVGIVVLLI